MFKIKFIVSILLCGISLLLSHIGVAQPQLPEIVAARHISFNSYANVEGSAYLFSEWKQASIYMKAGNIYKGILIKINIYENEIYFLRNDTTYELYQDNISEITIIDHKDSLKNILISKNYNKPLNLPPNKLVQVFCKGKISLVKVFRKEIRKEYDHVHSKTVTEFRDLDQYYVIENGHPNKISFSKNNLYTIISAKKERMEEFLKKTTPNLKTPQGFALALNHYNNL